MSLTKQHFPVITKMGGKVFRRNVNFNHMLLSSMSISKVVRKPLCVYEKRLYLIRMHFDSEGLQPKQLLNPECLKIQPEGWKKTNWVPNSDCVLCQDYTATEKQASAILPRNALLPSAQGAGMEKSWPCRDCSHSVLLLWFYVLLLQKL